MYAASLVLLLLAIVTLAVGFVAGGLVLIFISIAASAAAAIVLSVWVLRRPAPRPVTVGGPLEPEEGTGEAAGSTTVAAPTDARAEEEAPERRSSWSPRISSEVVALPARGTYHAPGCRFVKERLDIERLTSEAAKHRGYSACGVCKPE